MSDALTEPSSIQLVVTPSDTTVFSPPFRSLYVGTTGNVTITNMAGTAVAFMNVPSGTTLPVRGTKVNAATTATNIVALQ